jgi:hypothetical protein
MTLPEFRELRQCVRCEEEFSITTQNKKKRFCSVYCREKAWVEANRERLNENTRNYRARRYKREGRWRDEGKKAKELKKWMVEIKSHPCCDCGRVFPICCMDFEHREGTKKKYNIGTMFAHHYSRELIETELVKCDLVCANCHRVRTQKRRIGSGKNA